MSHDKQRVRQLLRLTPLVEKPIPFDEFLVSLVEHPERADSAQAVVYRAIMAMGAEEFDKETDPERRQYLKMLKDMEIPSLNAFKHVAGNQRFALGPMSFLKSASSGGAQLKQMLIIEGGSGAGKDFFKDGIIKAIERYTTDVEKVYAIKGCPHHENPINLLKLFTPEQLKELAKETGLDETLTKLLNFACEPCQHCYDQVMGTLETPKEEPSFDGIEVLPMRLSARVAGLSEWQPGGTGTLSASLDKANRGFISMPDAFIERKPKEGETDERLVLLDATVYRRLPGEPTEDGGATAASPLDTFILCTTNRKALEQFLEEVVPDKDAFTSRAVILKLPYNLIRCEEVRVYRTERNKYKERPHFDPLVEHVLATLAVLSRFPVPERNDPFVHPIDRMRLYQGDPIQPTAKTSSEWSKVWDTSGSSSSGYGGYSSWSPRGSESSSKSVEDKPELPKLPTDVPLSTGILWSITDPNEGQAGLDMRYMLGMLSSINEYGLQKPKHKCVNSLEVIRILRGAMARKAKSSSLTEDQKKTYERCLKWLGGQQRAEMDVQPVDTPDIIEGEFRRMLREILLQVFAPDYSDRDQKLFNDYRLHAPAAFDGKQTVKDPQMGNIPVNAGLVDELNRYPLGKPKGATLSDEDKKFRGQLDAQIGILREEFVEQLIEQVGEEKAKEKVKEFKVDWETIPELRKAISGKLNDEIGSLMEKLITTEVKSDLRQFEQEQLERAEKALQNLNFCPACLKPVLE